LRGVCYIFGQAGTKVKAMISNDPYDKQFAWQCVNEN
jgi:hypothetical protein